MTFRINPPNYTIRFTIEKLLIDFIDVIQLFDILLYTERDIQTHQYVDNDR